MSVKIGHHNWREVVAGAAVEAAEKVEEKLIGRRSRRNLGAVVNEEEDADSSISYFDNNGGIEELAANLQTVDFEKVLNNVVKSVDETGNATGEICIDLTLPPCEKSQGHDSHDNAKEGLVSGVCLPPSLGHTETGNSQGALCLPPSLGHNETGNSQGALCLPPSLGHDSQSSTSVRKGIKTETTVEEVEEVVELEFFDQAVNKLSTHAAYCPKCSSRITKVVLRRVRRETTTTTFQSAHNHHLFGCLSCFSVFALIGRKLNPFPIFGGTDSSGVTGEPHLSDTSPVPSGSASEGIKPVETEDGCFDLRWFSRKRREQEHALEQKEPADHESQSSKKPLLAAPAKGPQLSGSVFDLGEEGGFIPGAIPPPKKSGETKGDDWQIEVGDTGVSSSTVDNTNTRNPVEVNESKSVEIVKSIVYGGLIESITSLGVISSAAASDVGTLKIVTIGVANLIAGFFVICQSLMDLKYNAGGGPNLSDRYQELLGQKNNFLLHATFALFSYLVFGLVPPLVYGFTFRESDDKDYKIIAAAVASLSCIIILAAAKAYTQGANKFSKYFKTILSYATAAGMASGVGYASGHLIKRFIDQLGWFDNKPVPSVFLTEPNSQNPAWASY